MTLFGRNTREQSVDDQAIERHRYLLRTAPPDTIEQALARVATRAEMRQPGSAERLFGGAMASTTANSTAATSRSSASRV